MSEFFGSVWWLLVTLGILVTFHEFGHFWVARRFGVKVLRFSVGFGKPIWSRFGRDGTEYAIGSIPLGGYVKFLDAREAENPELAARQPGEFNAAPVWQRMAISAAGPAFNLIFTVVAFWAMFVIGRPDFQPVVGIPQGMAAEAGFKFGDRLTAVDGEKVESWSNAILGVAQAAMLHHDVGIDVIDAQGNAVSRTLPLSKLPSDVAENAKTFASIGLFLQSPAVIGSISVDKPADRAGMKAGDRIVRINDIAITDFDQVTSTIGEQAAKNPHLNVVVKRDGHEQPLDIVAEQSTIEGDTRWRIGVGPAQQSHDAIEHYGPVKAIPAALAEMRTQVRRMAQVIGGMLTGQASTKNLSSIISIAEVANASANQGLAWFLSFLAVISLSLGILNLLPIPILDGGHLVYYLIELVKGSPVSERTLIAGQYVGFALLMTLMSVAFYNDIVRHLHS